MRNPKRASLGFTLIEIMIVVAIVGIVAAIAIPSYVSSTRASHRTDAKQALTQLAQFMERNYTLASRYDKDSAANNIALPFTTSPLQGTTFYNLTVTATTTTYTLTATPTGGQTKDSCGTLTLTNTGVKGSTSGASSCW
ncbi:MAG TPA: type IV pilin protein [Burkholderiaceae bacterium]|jgi:type IV pilus assembly protein PilE